MLAIIKSVGNSDVRPIRQEAFALEVIPYYSQSLLKAGLPLSCGKTTSRLTRQHFKRDWISSDTFTDSYLTILEVAAKTDDQLLDDLIERLSPIEETEDRLKHTLLATSIAASQYMPRRRLRGHLDDVGSRITVLPMGENRLDLVAKLFTTISQNLSDNARGMGMTWWWEWKDRLLGREDGKPVKPVRAKL